MDCKDDLLLLWKAYPSMKGKICGGLKSPTNSFFSVVLTAYNVFELEFKHSPHFHDIGKFLFALIEKQILIKHFDFWSNSICAEHGHFIIKLFLKMQIFNEVK